ncbi:MAG: hypothetical protein DI529_13775 [Chryseobacterium sp.]|nr:MAG: hypothetical protein DI529_13775 [Chryseobacterium sp.]
MNKYINVFEKNKGLAKQKGLKENVVFIMNFFLYKLIFFGLAIYQLLLIWVPAIFEQMSQK